MILAALLAGLLAFVAVLRLLRARDVAARVVATAQTSVLVMADASLDEDEKERRIRRASIALFKSFFAILGIGVLSCGAIVAIVWGGAAAGLYALDAAIATATGWPFLLGSTIAAVALWLALDRMGKAPDKTDTPREEVPYGPLDKALHAYAFGDLDRQVRLGRMETRLYRRRIDRGHADRPVFVTSLPRAGTTIMLDVLANTPDFASATYRHMPFTLAPLLWGGFSSAFRKTSTASERAHGDGIEVSVDSPEAFEEMLWMAFFPDHYGAESIRPWTREDRHAEFEEFFRAHMAKIVATKPGATRYVSKNNANVARLGLIETLFPDAGIVIPVRDPCAHVASLMRQHARFADLHGREDFARQYMEGIGHFEFGAALRPIDFGADLDRTRADQPDFWLRYWIAAYDRVLRDAGEGAFFVDHDALSSDPAAHLPVLAEAVGLDASGALLAQSDRFRPSRKPPTLDGASPDLVARARSIHETLLDRAIIAGSLHSRLEIPA